MRYIILHVLIIIDAIPINEPPIPITAINIVNQDFANVFVMIDIYAINMNSIVPIIHNISLPIIWIIHPNSSYLIFVSFCGLLSPVNRNFICLIFTYHRSIVISYIKSSSGTAILQIPSSRIMVLTLLPCGTL